MKLLLVDDDARLTGALRRGLSAEGFHVEVAANGPEALWRAAANAYDVILLDVMLAGRNGYQVCADLRRRGDATPILMLTAKDGDLDVAEGLDTGADDYLTKPFAFVVLVARIHALLRRSSAVRVPALTVGDLRLDPRARRARRGAVELSLTTRELDVLIYLARRAGQVVSKRELLAGVWEDDFDGDPNVVEVYVRRLRRKVDEPFGRHSIQTVRGAGYRLDPA